VTASAADWAGLPIGDWATWAAAFVSLLAFAAIVIGLRVEGSRRRADIARLDALRYKDELSAQARLVDAWVSHFKRQGDHLELTVSVSNSSPQAVRAVSVLLTWDKVFPYPAAFRYEVVPPTTLGSEYTKVVEMPPPEDLPIEEMLTATISDRLYLTLVFTDTRGTKWRRSTDGDFSVMEESESLRYEREKPARWRDPWDAPA
jgi:hypothetical protein